MYRLKSCSSKVWHDGPGASILALFLSIRKQRMEGGPPPLVEQTRIHTRIHTHQAAVNAECVRVSATPLPPVSCSNVHVRTRSKSRARHLGSVRLYRRDGLGRSAAAVGEKGWSCCVLGRPTLPPTLTISLRGTGAAVYSSQSRVLIVIDIVVIVVVSCNGLWYYGEV